MPLFLLPAYLTTLSVSKLHSVHGSWLNMEHRWSDIDSIRRKYSVTPFDPPWRCHVVQVYFIIPTNPLFESE
jgi:hypothetical protein